MAGLDDDHLMFDRYLYDYLRKNNMHRTAQIFKEEAHRDFDPRFPPAIDVPDGYLHEWWLVFYDMFRAWQPQGHDPREDPSIMVEQMMEARQQTNVPLSRKLKMNENTIVQSPLSTDSVANLIKRCNAMGSMSGTLTEAQKIPQGFPSSSHQQKLLTSGTPLNLPGNLTQSFGHEAGSSVHAALRTSNIAPNEGADIMSPGFNNHLPNPIQVTEDYWKACVEKLISAKSGREIRNTSDSQDQSSSMLGDPYLNSNASLAKYQSLDDNVISSPSHADDNRDKVDAFSNLPECSDSHQVVESNRGIKMG